MNVLRLTTITLSLTLLAACGGGGGGGGTPTTGGGGEAMLERLPELLIPASDVQTAIAVFGGLEPPPDAPTPTEVGMQVFQIAMSSDALLFSEMASGGGINAERMITCTPGEAMCTAMIDTDTTDNRGPDTQMERPEEINGPVLFNDGEALAGYNDSYSIVMGTTKMIPIVQTRAAGRLNGERYEYQGYGGWMQYSVFIIQEQTASMQGNAFSAVSAYSFGKATGMNPTVNATWEGVMVGRANIGDIIQGNVNVEWDSGTPNSVSVEFTDIKNLSNEGNANPSSINWPSIPLMEGAFVAMDGSISGNFYGNAHEEVGGIFDREGIFGAFGARTQ